MLRPGLKPTTVELHRDLGPLKDALRTELLSRGIHWSDHQIHLLRTDLLVNEDFLSRVKFSTSYRILTSLMIEKSCRWQSCLSSLRITPPSLFLSATGLDLGQRSTFGLLFRSLGDIFEHKLQKKYAFFKYLLKFLSCWLTFR